jgi:hypothetical protein
MTSKVAVSYTEILRAMQPANFALYSRLQLMD